MRGALLLVSLKCIRYYADYFFDKAYDFNVTSFISDSQFCFVRNRSTLLHLLLYSEFLHNAYDNRQQVDSIYLDISKAFDTVSHAKLLSKLWNAGIIGN